ncbi:non-hydrolyzing UDP-N-acetylglucosamine 2-epimerase [Tenacibaculum aestuariivivum]|uniref:non-hydrolyzing UDP-N-acetylglucosamine 2-epimerase n=1 Tax=Tenacibaculum aestuariivivum TaxID=2006131 RepID=UPI003AB70FE8
MRKKILIVVGTRPNFVKITQFKKQAILQNIDLKIAHTGQHYDEKMSAIFLENFNIKVDYFLNINGKSANSLIGEIMIKLEGVINEFNPDLLLSVGDVNSTLAASITANKLNLKLGHVESGLRSLDREMPEEINRVITDEISDICFVTEESGIENLKNIGKTDSQIAYVGNTMIDTLVHFKEQIEASTILDDITYKNYILVTMHRPRNVDTKESLHKIISLLQEITIKYNIVFSLHPRTKKSFIKNELLNSLKSIKRLKIIPPQNYFAFQKLIKYSFCVVTDSGGIQEETTFQKIPCITLRENTERPVTITKGTNILMSFDNEKIINHLKAIENKSFREGEVPIFWDGNATERILKKCIAFLS